MLFLDRDLVASSVRLITFHFLYILLCLSILMTSRTQPGNIPAYWGFYIGEQDSRKKRYCLICNLFKPERTHHCSICNKCVLNMDHHCPWVHNCIGFYNKKFFIQMLTYFLLTCLFMCWQYFTETSEAVKVLMKMKSKSKQKRTIARKFRK